MEQDNSDSFFGFLEGDRWDGHGEDFGWKNGGQDRLMYSDSTNESTNLHSYATIADSRLDDIGKSMAEWNQTNQDLSITTPQCAYTLLEADNAAQATNYSSAQSPAMMILPTDSNGLQGLIDQLHPRNEVGFVEVPNFGQFPNMDAESAQLIAQIQADCLAAQLRMITQEQVGEPYSNIMPQHHDMSAQITSGLGCPHAIPPSPLVTGDYDGSNIIPVQAFVISPSAVHGMYPQPTVWSILTPAHIIDQNPIHNQVQQQHLSEDHNQKDDLFDPASSNLQYHQVTGNDFVPANETAPIPNHLSQSQIVSNDPCDSTPESVNVSPRKRKRSNGEKQTSNSNTNSPMRRNTSTGTMSSIEDENQEIANYAQKQTSPRLKRPMNAYLLFCEEWREKCRHFDPFNDTRKLAVKLGELWRRIPDNLKQPYIAMAEKIKSEFLNQHPEYRYTRRSRPKAVTKD
eukprot:TRINITY_DN9885_c0_g1_i1.p1 TRINITY_DN9885_c0_g1~~TRINITY_DN9885_c0_g1_i1.p1  ORF type:complete len:457 (-),score=101.74 TRINITY_DN9885_c0_g1_i1:732-2102(-)